MRTLSPIVICFLVTLSGCATRWIVFGHSVGGSAPGSAAQPVVTAPPVSVTQTTETAPSASGTQPIVTAPAESEARLASQPSASTAGPASTPEWWKIAAVEVTFTPAVREKIAAQPQFTEGGLYTAVQGELRTRKLLDESDPGGGDTIRIVVDDFTTRPTSNAVLFGHVFSSGTLQGTLEVLGSDGKQLRSARIRARSSLTKPAGAAQSSFFEPLYREFADLTARNLTGAPEPVGVNH